MSSKYVSKYYALLKIDPSLCKQHKCLHDDVFRCLQASTLLSIRKAETSAKA